MPSSRLDEIDLIKDGLRNKFAGCRGGALPRPPQWRGHLGLRHLEPGAAGSPTKLLKFLRNTEDSQITSLTERNRSEIWKLVRKYVTSGDRAGNRMKLTAKEDRAFRAAKIGSDDIGDALQGNMTGLDPTAMLDELIESRRAIDGLLDRRTEASLRRTANNASIPKPYEEAAINEHAFVKNYIAEVDTIPTRIKQVREAVAHPEDPIVYGEAANIILESEILSNRLSHLTRGQDFEDWLRDPANADTILAALPEATVALTPVDEALIAAASATGPEARRLMDAAIDELNATATVMEGGVAVALTKRKPPIKNVTLDQAEDIAAGRAPRAAGADGGLGTNMPYQAAKKRIPELETELEAARAAARFEPGLRSGGRAGAARRPRDDPVDGGVPLEAMTGKPRCHGGRAGGASRRQWPCRSGAARRPLEGVERRESCEPAPAGR